MRAIPIDRAGGAASTDNRSPGPALPLAHDQETTGGAPDAISTLLAFLKDKLEDTDLVQAQQLVEQALSDTSDDSGAGNMSAGTPAMDARASTVGPEAGRCARLQRAVGRERRPHSGDVTTT